MGPIPGLFALFTAAGYLRRPDAEAAAEAFEQRIPKENLESPWVRTALAFLALDLANGEQRFKELTKDLLKEPPGIVWRFALSVMCLTKSPDEIRELAQSGGAAFLEGDDEGGVWIGRKCHRLLAGQESEADVLKAAQGHQYALCNAHFTIAVLGLAAGNREAALYHFKLCTDTVIIGSPDYELARAFYERMMADPDWMPGRSTNRAETDASGEK